MTPARAGAWPLGRPRAFAFLPRFLFDPDIPVWRYVLLAWPIVALPSLLFGLLASRLAPGLAAPELGGGPGWLLFVGVVVFSPLIETIIMTGPIALLGRRAGPVWAAVASAVLWAVAHSLLAARWGLVIWWPFLIFSIAYLTCRGAGYWRAVGIVFAIHALQNASPIIAFLLLR